MSWTLLPAASLGAHAGRWRQLHADSAASPLLDLDFVLPLVAEFGDGGELLACCERDGQLLAMAVLARGARASWQTFQPAQAPIGIWLQRPGLDLDALLADLRRSLPGPALVLGLTQCDPYLAPRPADGAAVRTIDYIDTARITLAGGFDAYWNGRGKNLRSNLKKQRAKLLKDGVATRLQVSREAQDVAAAVADYGRLESAGWKAQGGTAIHPDNPQGRYYRAMLEAFCRRGAASIYRYWFGQQLVAMDFCIEGAGCIIVLKTTYDETIPNSLSPALLMREEACRRLFDEGRFERIEFYGKVMEWHLRWTEEVRTLYHVNTYRWPALLRLHQLAARGAAWRHRNHANRVAE